MNIFNRKGPFFTFSLFLSLVLIFSTTSFGQSAELFVSEQRNNQNIGTIQSPFAFVESFSKGATWSDLFVNKTCHYEPHC